MDRVLGTFLLETCCIEQTDLYCILQEIITMVWFTIEIIQNNINKFWGINTKQKHSWKANYLILLINVSYLWIKIVLENGERTYIWSSKWSSFGRLSSFLRVQSSTFLDMASNFILAELWESDQYVLATERSDNHVSIFSHITSLSITDKPDSTSDVQMVLPFKHTQHDSSTVNCEFGIN